MGLVLSRPWFGVLMMFWCVVGEGWGEVRGSHEESPFDSSVV